MLKRNYIQLGLITVVLAALFIMLRSSGRVMQKPDSKESMGSCCKKINSQAQEDLIWQSFSRQFISFTSCSN